MNYYLLKRNADVNAVSGKHRKTGEIWFNQTAINRKPAGSNMKVGDEVYLYEVDYAVWAKGEVTKVDKAVATLKTVNQTLKFARKKTRIDSEHYWGHTPLGGPGNIEENLIPMPFQHQSI